MAKQSLQDKIDAHGDLWSMLYDGPVHRFEFPVKPEFSNWVDEQIAWRTSVIFQNMSHHMTDVFLRGPDVIRRGGAGNGRAHLSWKVRYSAGVVDHALVGPT